MNQEELRQRLIKLLMQKGFGVEGATIAADHLIANGVTIDTCGRDCKSCWKTKLVNQTTRWIPVTERLPEEKVMVLGFYHTVYKDGGHYDLILVMELINGLFVPFNCSPIKNGSVTHWMPLPEPPEAEKGR